MAFSSLTSLTQEQYNALSLTPFRTSPTITKTGNPDADVTPGLGGWVSETVLAFTINVAADTAMDLNIDSSLSLTLDIVLGPSAGNDPYTTYWTVDVGSSDSKSTTWSISFQVQAEGTNTGTWVFKKGGVGDDELLTEESDKKYN